MAEDLATLVTSIGRRARAASLALAATTTAAKNEALLRLADAIDAAHAPLLAANRTDFAALKQAVAYATAVSSLTVESFSVNSLSAAGRREIDTRFRKLRQLTRF